MSSPYAEREIYETQTSGGGDFDSPDQMKGGDAQ